VSGTENRAEIRTNRTGAERFFARA